MSRVIVIGCNSFTGGYVVDELLAGDEHEVLGIDRQSATRLNVPYLDRDLSRWRFVAADLNVDRDTILTLVRSEQPDFVINLAALSEVAPSWEHPEQWLETNGVALTAVADVLRQLPNLQRFVQVSTPEVYGSVRGAIDESAPLHPSTPYAASKAAFDLMLETFIDQYQFPAVFVRASNVYGAHQQLFKIVPRTFIYVRLGKMLELHGGGTATRAYIHVRDVARGYLAALFGGRTGEVYHISPDDTVTVRELVERICAIAEVKFATAVAVGPSRPGHDEIYMLNSHKIHQELSWQPLISLDKGLREVETWVDVHWPEIQAQTLEYVHRA